MVDPGVHHMPIGALAVFIDQDLNIYVKFLAELR